MTRALGYLGPLLCIAAGACLVAGLAVELDSAAAKVLMAVAAILFVPGSLLTLGWVRARLGPPA
ncbi:MAG TPA: hypothetical protein VH572_11790 [Gaiella sp.]